MNRFKVAVCPPLLETAISVHDKYPNWYQRMTADGKEALSVAFFGIENSAPRFIYNQFEARFSPGGIVPAAGVLEPNHYRSWGHTKPVKDFLDKNPGYFDRVGDAKEIRNLIQLAIEDEPDIVGPPIAILRVGRDGAEWMQQSPCCPPIQEY